jgi:putative hydrolase of the HAD superfamily
VDFHTQFKKVNEELWNLYDRGLIDSEVIRRERFKQILEPFKAYEEKLSEDISRDYLHICPKKGNLMPHARETLDYLVRHYRLTIVTNGFEDIQHQKVKAGQLTDYFDHVVTSQKAGHKKPSREIFECALNLGGIRNHEAIMIGDNLITDIGGARNASISTVFFNSEKATHSGSADHEINSLHELHSIL